MVQQIEIPRPDSPLSSSSGSPPRLDPSTLALLDNFLTNKAEEERRFEDLLAAHDASRVSGLDGDDINGFEEEKSILSVEEYRKTFTEDWQLSQFWYSTKFAYHFADLINKLEPSPDSSIAFVCSPTAFVAFQHSYPRPQTKLLEVDQRFAVLTPTHYIPYDLDEPDNFPTKLKNNFDLVVADPPFLNEVTNTKLIRTLKQILKPTGKLILLTSTSVEDILEKLYIAPPIGPLIKTSLKVEHGQLANDFACWGSWEEAESFGKD